MRRTAWVIVLLAGCAAETSLATKSRNAAAITADLLGGSKQNPRETSGTNCYPACREGTACNEDTATCDLIPCGGKCRTDQVCNQSGIIESCVKQPVDAGSS